MTKLRRTEYLLFLCSLRSFAAIQSQEFSRRDRKERKKDEITAFPAIPHL
jgi:hypothetical protein